MFGCYIYLRAARTSRDWARMEEAAYSLSLAGRKVNRPKFRYPACGTDRSLTCEPQVAARKRTLPVRRGNATGHGDAGVGLGKSYLFSVSGRGPGILSEGDRVLA